MVRSSLFLSAARLSLAVVVLFASTIASRVVVVNVPLTSASGCGGPDNIVPDWYLHNRNGSISNVAACLPGNVYTHLHRAGVLPESPLYRFNDVNYRWVAYENWTYELHLPLQSAMQPLLPLLGANYTSLRVELVGEGIRVFSKLSLRVEPGAIRAVTIGNTTSQFLQYVWDVTDILAVPLTNAATANPLLHVSLAFESTVLAAIQLNNSYSLQPFPQDPAYLVDLPARNFVRTEQSSFGWDWGPAFAPVGVDVSLQLRVSCFVPEDDQSGGEELLLWRQDAKYRSPALRPMVAIRQLFPQVLHVPTAPGSYDVFRVNFTFEVEIQSTISALPNCAVAGNCTVELVVNVTAPTLTWMNNSEAVAVLGNFVYRGLCGTGYCWRAYVSANLFLQNPDLWWPRGYGAPVLHAVSGTIAVTSFSTMQQGSGGVAWTLSPLAIRAVALVTHGSPQDGIPASPMDYAPPEVATPSYTSGHSMYFAINGIPVFAKGANVIPASAFPDPTDKERLLRDMTSAMAANMNIVRVWGGGYYKADWFYAFCDANGIMVWQEIMFACAEYPVDTDFLDLVRREVAEQIQRLAQFGSIVLWSANNENDIYDIGSGAGPYHILYTETVMDTLVQYDWARPMWPSSPSEGFLSGVDINGLPDGEPIVRDKNLTKLGHTPRGDTHYYNYFSCPDYAAYPRTHFASEFGFQSLPWLENLAPISNESLGDWSLNSSFMNHRQHHPDGNLQIAQLVILNFFPADTSIATIFELPFRRVIFLSQLQQLLCISDQASYYRRGRDYPATRTMGSMYWQLNQNWQAPSWTSLEFGGEWKALHYAMRRTYSDIHLSTYLDPNSSIAYAHVTNDGFDPLGPLVTRAFAVRYSDGASVLLSNASANCYGFVGGCSASLPYGGRQGGTFVWNRSVPSILADLSISALCQQNASNCFVWLEVHQLLAPNQFSLLTSGHPLFLSSLGAIGWGAARHDPVTAPNIVQVHVESVVLNQATVNVSLTGAGVGVALFVVVRSVAFPHGTFSDNLLHLIPCATAPPSLCAGSSSAKLTFTNPDGPIGDAASFLSTLVIETL